ncbi:MAG TPA: transporter [Chloroflexi bacterium]|jgi:hypothetical protein|nr:transporter [Chloroflexota bacterium]
MGASAPNVATEERNGALVLSGREVGVFNLFVGCLGFLIALATLLFAAARGESVGSASIESGSFILLFAFTYLWVAANQFIRADGRALGWYCLFVAITTVPNAFIAIATAHGHAWPLWLGIDWAAWGFLWFQFFLQLSLQKPIGRLIGFTAIVEGVTTCWIPAYLLLTGYLAAS